MIQNGYAELDQQKKLTEQLKRKLSEVEKSTSGSDEDPLKTSVGEPLLSTPVNGVEKKPSSKNS